MVQQCKLCGSIPASYAEHSSDVKLQKEWLQKNELLHACSPIKPLSQHPVMTEW